MAFEDGILNKTINQDFFDETHRTSWFCRKDLASEYDTTEWLGLISHKTKTNVFDKYPSTEPQNNIDLWLI